jgi:hypothetical protein
MHLQSDREGLKERIHSPAPAYQPSANESRTFPATPADFHAPHLTLQFGARFWYKVTR